MTDDDVDAVEDVARFVRGAIDLVLGLVVLALVAWLVMRIAEYSAAWP